MTVAGLVRSLADLDGPAIEPPAAGRVGATLVLLRQVSGGHVEVVYTRRQPNLSSHPGQISFPGGRVDPGETVVEAALREAQEEVALDPSSVTVLGRLPAFYIPPSRFWMSAVVASWDRPHPLHPAESEVADILSVSTDLLHDPATWRAVPLSAAGTTWAWQLGPRQLLWGATAVVTGVLLDLMDPGWSRGTGPADLPVDRQVRPWEDPEASGLAPAGTRSLARLRDTAVEAVDRTVAQGDGRHDPAALAADVVLAIDRLVRRPDGPVLVLAGEGSAGIAAAEVVLRLGRAGVEVTSMGAATPAEDIAQAIRGSGVIVDALADRSTPLLLPAAVRGVIGRLATSGAPLIAVDLPSGIDPDRGMVGEAVSADVTIARAPLLPAHSAPGVLPFIGDLYLSRPGRDLVRADVTGRPTAWAE